MPNYVVFILAALLVGALIPIQAALNVALSKLISSTGYAALALFAIGFICVSIFLVINKVSPLGLNLLISAPGYYYIGGVVISIYVLSTPILALRLGIGNTIFCIVSGQVLMAVMIDHFGWFNSSVIQLKTTRVLGCTLILIGIYFARR